MSLELSKVASIHYKELNNTNRSFSFMGSDRAKDIFKMYYRTLLDGTKETCPEDVINRVFNAFFKHCEKNERNHKSSAYLEDHICYGKQLLLNQYFCFNSPVLFNIGLEGRDQQASACFIQSVEDDLSSILELQEKEAKLFKLGSGTGSNISNLRGKGEALSQGGVSSGPMSFLRAYDAWAGTIKSGGASRRAAKLVCMDDDHPDILEFVECKSKVDKAAKDLISLGYSDSFVSNSETDTAYGLLPFQNTNLSVRLSDKFMEKVKIKDSNWELKYRNGGTKTVKTKEIWDAICQCAYECGDPGVQFNDKINKMNTTDIPIRASNPCGEFTFVDDSACNLVSINLLKFFYINEYEEQCFDFVLFAEVVKTVIILQNMLVDMADYPSEKIKENSIKYRPLGLGFTNLHALLMHMGMGYGSEDSVKLCSTISYLMTLKAYETSSLLGKDGEYNTSMSKYHLCNVVNEMIDRKKQLYRIDDITSKMFDELSQYVYNNDDIINFQTTLIAPTGTISFVMDCESTGIEPLMATKYYKKLVNGKTLELEPDCVTYAKDHFPYRDVFRTALGDNALHWTDHLNMMKACQPYISGAISKTINLPNDATPEDIGKVYYRAWEDDLKSITIYRDGSKGSQPLNLNKDKNKDKKENTISVTLQSRKKMKSEAYCLRKKMEIAGLKAYAHVGLFDDGETPGELFLQVSKQGSIINGLSDAFAVAVSLGLQHGVPIDKYCEHLKGVRFEPSGFTGDKDFPIVNSIVDYLFQWMQKRFVDDLVEEEKEEIKEIKPVSYDKNTQLCVSCGSPLVRTGTCFTCTACGQSTGCG